MSNANKLEEIQEADLKEKSDETASPESKAEKKARRKARKEKRLREEKGKTE